MRMNLAELLTYLVLSWFRGAVGQIAVLKMGFAVGRNFVVLSALVVARRHLVVCEPEPLRFGVAALSSGRVYRDRA